MREIALVQDSSYLQNGLKGSTSDHQIFHLGEAKPNTYKYKRNMNMFEKNNTNRNIIVVDILNIFPI